MTWVTAVWKGWDPDQPPPPEGPQSIRAGGRAAPTTTVDVFDVGSPFSYLRPASRQCRR